MAIRIGAQGPVLDLREGPSVRSAAGWPLSKRREAARSDLGEPFLAGPQQSPQHALRGSVSPCRTRGECPHTQVAVVVGGRKAGPVIHICTDEKCKTHRQFSHYEISPQEREQRRKLTLAIQVQTDAPSRSLV